MGRLLCTVLVWRCCGEVAMYCPGVEVLLWGGCYVFSWCGGSVVERLLFTVLVRRLCCWEAAMNCPGEEVLLWESVMYCSGVEVL